MVYLGSKSRLAKHLVPIIQSYIKKDTEGYLEPFVGGANIIDKINHANKVGADIHPELITLLIKAQVSTHDFPITITKDEYNLVKNNKEQYESWYVGLVGFCASFSAQYYKGFANSGDGRDRPAEMIRNLVKQAPNLKDITFINKSFEELDAVNNYVIYCDPPYRDTTKYKTKAFDYDKFYQWCRETAETNTVLVSEYSMPEDFTCIWEKEHKTYLSSTTNKKVEKLFIYNQKG